MRLNSQLAGPRAAALALTLAFLGASCATHHAPPAAEKPAVKAPEKAAVKPPEKAPAVSAKVDVAQEVERLLRDVEIGGDLRKPARHALIALGPDAIEPLVSHFHSPEFDVRWEVANVLGYIEDKRAVDALIERILNDDNPHIRWRSIWALAEIKDPTTPDRFRAELQNPSPVVAWNAVVGGSMFKVRETVPLLRARVFDEVAFTAWEAVNGLGRLPDPESVALLEQVVAGNRDQMRREAVLSLGHHPYPTARDVLVRTLDDADSEVRWRVAMVLSRYPEAGVEEALLARQRIETDKTTREKIESSLKAHARAKKMK